MDTNKSTKNKSSNPTSAPKKRRRGRSLVVTLWILFCLSVAAFFTFFILVYNGVIGYMPPVEELKNPNDRFASVIYSADGKEIGRFFKNTGNRLYADFDDISQNVVDALIATEDVRFEEHSGIDARGLGRVLVKTLIMRNKNAGGGSTITQQLAKQLYSPESNNLVSRAMQKPIEWMIAVKLERFYSKEEILKMYLNQFDFLYNAVGIKSAAHVYFGKEPKDLDLAESAMLVGMVKNPSYYNPIRFPERTLERRNVVLDQMVKAGKITQAEADEVASKPLGINFHKVDAKDGVAPYFREELRKMLRAQKPERSNYRGWEGQKFVDDSIAWETNPLFGWIEKNPKPDGSKYDIYTDGLRIYTTIDTRMQTYAEQAMREHLGQELQPKFFAEKRGTAGAPYSSNRTELSEIRLNYLIRRAIKNTDRYRSMSAAGASKEDIKRAFNTRREMKVFSYRGTIDTVMTPLDSLLYHKSFLRSGFMAMDPLNGHIKAYVGGPDFNFFQYDMVSQGRRQIGSTVKPFLYTFAMEEGYTPCSMMSNTQPVLYEKGQRWLPRNSSRARMGQMVDLKWALTNSNNWISARLISQLSPEALARTMHNFGITAHLEPVASLCLGPADVSVKEMVGAYSAFANNGMRVEPMFVTAIVDNNGNRVAEFTPKHTEVISETAYYRMLNMLLNVVNEGTAHRIRSRFGLSGEAGGKTGTTNYNADGWFMAFTPQLVTGTWVGGEERFIHFNSTADGQGAAMALPIYARFMKKLYEDGTLPYSEDAKFTFPDDVTLCDKVTYGGHRGGGGGDGQSSSSADTNAAATSMDDVFE